MANDRRFLDRVPPARLAAILVALVVLMQAVPYGRNHTNPAVSQEPAWDSPGTRTTFLAACGDCHSNRTTWPWYSHVAPVSWLVQHDVDEGRGKLNASEMDRPQKDAGEAAEAVRSGDMPPWQYRIMHPEARLSPDARRRLEAGLVATFGTGAEPGEDEGD
jgi:mono/diheme cytochrome c family protein